MNLIEGMKILDRMCAKYSNHDCEGCPIFDKNYCAFPFERTDFDYDKFELILKAWDAANPQTSWWDWLKNHKMIMEMDDGHFVSIDLHTPIPDEVMEVLNKVYG